jgi:hypothetical protein
MATARGIGRRQLGYALRRRIAALDPEEDHEGRMAEWRRYAAFQALRAIRTPKSRRPV